MPRITIPKSTRPLDLFSLIRVRETLHSVVDQVSRDYAIDYLERWLNEEIDKARLHIELTVERGA
jgi:hypothetical protein